MISIIFLVTWMLTIYFGYTLFSFWFLIPVYIILGYFVGILVLAILLILLMPLMKFTKVNTKFKYYLSKSAAKFLSFFILRAIIEVEGKENIPKTGKLTLYANHKSQTDPIFIMSVLNRGLAFTPKISLYKIPVLSNYMSYVGCLPIDRDDNRKTAKTMIKAIENVKMDHAMLIFPEGGIKTRETEEILEIKGGAFKIGTKSESDFLPITIIGATNFAKKRFFLKFLKVKLVIHPVIKYEDVSNLQTAELGELIKDTINKPFNK